MLCMYLNLLDSSPTGTCLWLWVCHITWYDAFVWKQSTCKFSESYWLQVIFPVQEPFEGYQMVPLYICIYSNPSRYFLWDFTAPSLIVFWPANCRLSQHKSWLKKKKTIKQVGCTKVLGDVCFVCSIHDNEHLQYFGGCYNELLSS